MCVYNGKNIMAKKVQFLY